MNKIEIENMQYVGDYFCKRIRDIKEENDDCWYKLQERQAFIDALNALKYTNFIIDFDIFKGVVVNTERVASHKKVFVPFR